MSTLINAPFMPLFERIESEEDVNDLVVQILDQLFHKPVLFVRFMVVDELIRFNDDDDNEDDDVDCSELSESRSACIVCVGDLFVVDIDNESNSIFPSLTKYLLFYCFRKKENENNTT